MSCIKYKYIKQDGIFKNCLRIIKFNIRKIYYKNNFKILNNICFNNNEQISKYFINNPALPIDLLHIKYGCKAFSFKSSLECFRRDLNLIYTYYKDLFITQKVLLKMISNEYAIYLKNTPRMINEGLFFLSLEFDGKTIYDMSFVSLDDGILITCLQGGGMKILSRV